MPEETFTTGSVQLEEEETQVGHPPLFAVVFFNDDYTPMEFVIQILEQIFNRSSAEATRIMLTVHRQGTGIAGVYSKEIATTKCDKSIQIAREFGFPLMLEIEPEE